MNNFKFKIIITIASIISPVTFAYCGFLEWYDYYKTAEKYTKEENIEKHLMNTN